MAAFPLQKNNNDRLNSNFLNSSKMKNILYITSHFTFSSCESELEFDKSKWINHRVVSGYRSKERRTAAFNSDIC